jgi:hypothetical protein
MDPLKLFHTSEEAGITLFSPRPSPSHFPGIRGDVVFAISERLLHNYLLPRDCPRVTYYTNADSSSSDMAKFMGQTSADYIIAVETRWYPAIVRTRLYCYEFPVEGFRLLDDNAGYYISYEQVAPLSVREINDIPAELFRRNIELRFMPDLWKLADAVKQSSLSYSIIRIRNAIPGKK